MGTSGSVSRGVCAVTCPGGSELRDIGLRAASPAGPLGTGTSPDTSYRDIVPNVFPLSMHGCMDHLPGSWVGSPLCVGPGWGHLPGSQAGSPVWVLAGVTCLGPRWGHLPGPLNYDASVSCPTTRSSTSPL